MQHAQGFAFKRKELTEPHPTQFLQLVREMLLTAAGSLRCDSGRSGLSNTLWFVLKDGVESLHVGK